MDNTPESSSTSKRKKTNWLWLAVVAALVVFAAIADLRSCVASHGTPPSEMDGGIAGESAALMILLFQCRPRWMPRSRLERMVREATEHLPSIEVRTVDLGDPANRHCIFEFGIQEETAVLVDGGRCVVLDGGPAIGRDEVAFKAGIADFFAARKQMGGAVMEGRNAE
jgi:hypothetical protein